MRRAKGDIKSGDWVFLGVQDGKGKYESGEDATGPFLILRSEKCTLVINLGTMVELVYLERVVKASELQKESPREAIDATGQGLREHNVTVPSWVVRKLLDHRVSDGTAQFQVQWKENMNQLGSLRGSQVGSYSPSH